jgi:hypothetical protein
MEGHLHIRDGVLVTLDTRAEDFNYNATFRSHGSREDAAQRRTLPDFLHRNTGTRGPGIEQNFYHYFLFSPSKFLSNSNLRYKYAPSRY